MANISKTALCAVLALVLSTGLLAGVLAQTGVTEQVKQLDQSSPSNLGDPVQQKLRGLQGAINTLDPTLDKSLLVTPGVHQSAPAIPLSQLTDKLLARLLGRDIRRGKFYGWLVTVSNNSDRPVLFDGDAAECTSNSGPAFCVSMERLAALSILPEQSPDFKKKFLTDAKATVTAAVTVGWAQTIHDQKKGSGPIVGANGGRYGLDEQRREDNLRRFGKRVLWPGDSTTGVIYFDNSGPVGAPVITMPVASYYDKADQSRLTFLP